MNDHHHGNNRGGYPDYDPRDPRARGPPGSVISGSSGMMGPPPPQTIVTVNTDTTPGTRVTEINLNIGYFKTLPGILKIIQLVS